MSGAGLISMSEYARQRGVSPQYISQVVKRGTFKLKKGKVDPAIADAALGAMADPGKAAVVASHAARRAGPPDAPAVPPPAASPEGIAPVGQFNRAKTVDATFVAKLRELEYKKQIGELIERGPYAKACEEASAALWKELDAMQHRLAPLVFGAESIQRCRELIAAEVTRSAQQLADTLDALAADPRAGTRQ